MSTDTAFALGMLGLVAPRAPIRLRAFMLTVAVVDDLVALAVIATAYTDRVHARALLVSLGLFALVMVAMRLGIRQRSVYALLGVATWLALSKSGVNPIVIGLGMGLLTFAAPAARGDSRPSSAAAPCGRRSAGQPSPAVVRSPESASPSRCSSPESRSAASNSARRSSEFSPQRSAGRSLRGSSSAGQPCCRVRCALEPCSARRRRSLTSPCLSNRRAIIFEAREPHRSRSSSTEISSVPSAGGRSL